MSRQNRSIRGSLKALPANRVPYESDRFESARAEECRPRLGPSLRGKLADQGAEPRALRKT